MREKKGKREDRGEKKPKYVVYMHKHPKLKLFCMINMH